MRALRISSISTVEPITVDEVKKHLRISVITEDGLLGAYITAARQAAENMMKRSLINTQWEYTIDDFLSVAIRLPMGAPMATASTEVSIVYTKTTGDTTTLSATVYDVQVDNEPGLVTLGHNQVWPTDVQDTPGSVVITFRAGYLTAEACPEAIKHWMKVRVGQMFEYREPLITGAPITYMKRDFIDGLLDPYALIEI